MLIGEDVVHGQVFSSVDPSNPTTVVANAHAATAQHAPDAITAAERGQKVWSQRLRDERAAALSRAAGILRSRRSSSPRWPSASAASRGRRPTATSPRRSTSSSTTRRARSRSTPAAADPDAGRAQRDALRPRGVTGVIAPWNFPLAIAAGMVVRRAGDRQRRRPQARRAGARVRQGHRRRAARRRRPARRAVPAARRRRARQGAGRRPAHPHDRLHRLLRRRPEHPRDGQQGRPGPAPHQARHRRDGRQERVIVDSDADLDDVVPGLLKSAFAFAGQKCSAASRALIHQRDRRRARRAPRGRAQHPQGRPRRRLRHRRPAGDRHRRPAAHHPTSTAATPLAQGDTRDDGFYVAPTLFHDLPDDRKVDPRGDLRPGPRAWRRSRASSTPASSSTSPPFALTGGLFSRSPRTIEYVSERTPVGNLYVNREITGAMVGRQPFGGGRLSGTGPKAGGPDYLLQFVEARAVSRTPSATASSSSDPRTVPGDAHCVDEAASHDRCAVPSEEVRGLTSGATGGWGVGMARTRAVCWCLPRWRQAY